jgi:Secretion system C-terminal sorting domain
LGANLAKTVTSTTATNDFFTTNCAPQIGDKIFIQLEAGEVNGLHKFTTFNVQTSDQYPSDVCDHSSAPLPQKFDPTKGAFEVFPNPVNSSKITVAFNFSEAQNGATLDLISMDGRVLKTLFAAEKIEKVGEQIFQLPKNLPAGIYLLRLRLADNVITKRIEVLR